MATSWLTARGRLDLSTPRLMGIVNVSPDSFSDGGRLLDADQAIAHARTLQAEGADIVDIGGESTRPNADEVSVTTELERVVPVVEGLSGEMVSVDTSKGEVAAAALAAGAAIVNDVRAGEDPRLLESVAAYNAGLVLMHMQGNPRTMQENPTTNRLSTRSASSSPIVRAAMQAGVSREQICVDPGIGFGKNLDHNLELLAGLEELARLGYPLVIGTSRKGFLGQLTGLDVAADRDVATAVSVVLAWERGGSIFRAHNVAVCKAALAVGVAIVRPSEG